MPKSPSLSLLALALLSCGSDIKVAQTALCDGVLQASEDEVDAPFDRDGDGYFDGSNRNCQEAYDASVLDCNDADPSAYPGNDELPCDGVDNDCDETSIDEEDYDGDRFTSCRKRGVQRRGRRLQRGHPGRRGRGQRHLRRLRGLQRRAR